MSESPQYEAFRAFAQAHIELAVLKATDPLKEEIRSLKTQLETRSVQGVEGPPGKDGKDGADGKDGRDGTDGKPGERGADGMVTEAEVDAKIEARMADIQVRTFADIYKGVYKPGESYTRSNVTTWGGSLWLALSDTRSKPGETPDWKLVVKK
jgi:hypothetical protein